MVEGSEPNGSTAVMPSTSSPANRYPSTSIAPNAGCSGRWGNARPSVWRKRAISVRPGSGITQPCAIVVMSECARSPPIDFRAVVLHREACERAESWASDERVDAPLLRRALADALAIGAMTPPVSDAIKADYLEAVPPDRSSPGHDRQSRCRRRHRIERAGRRQNSPAPP